MSILSDLQRRARRIIRLGIVSWVLFAASPFLASAIGFRALPVVAFVPFIAAAIAISFFVRCPRCGGNLGLLIARTLAPGCLRSAMSHCPCCGTRLDASSASEP